MSLRSEVIDVLQAAGLSPSRKLGQNFMVDGSAVAALIDAAAPLAGTRVVEVGPGTGILTRRLLDGGARVRAVELDRGLAGVLRERLVPLGLDLVDGDALASKARLHPAIEEWAEADDWILASNLPYDVSLPVILNALALPRPPRRVVVTIQWEAAERLCSEPGSKAWGATAAVAQAAGAGTIVRRLPPACFYPRPKIDSAILSWTPERRLPAGFPVWCRSLFSYRRKRVSRGLRDTGVERETAHALVERLGLADDRRVEQLSVAELLALHSAWEETTCE